MSDFWTGPTGQQLDTTYPDGTPDTSLAKYEDTDPQSGGSKGIVYDLDAPGVAPVVSQVGRIRYNFKEKTPNCQMAPMSQLNFPFMYASLAVGVRPATLFVTMSRAIMSSGKTLQKPHGTYSRGTMKAKIIALVLTVAASPLLRGQQQPCADPIGSPTDSIEFLEQEQGLRRSPCIPTVIRALGKSHDAKAVHTLITYLDFWIQLACREWATQLR